MHCNNCCRKSKGKRARLLMMLPRRRDSRNAGTHMKALLGVQVMEIIQNQKYLSNDYVYVYWTLVNSISVIILVVAFDQYDQQHCACMHSKFCFKLFIDFKLLFHAYGYIMGNFLKKIPFIPQ